MWNFVEQHLYVYYYKYRETVGSMWRKRKKTEIEAFRFRTFALSMRKAAPIGGIARSKRGERRHLSHGKAAPNSETPPIVITL